MKSLKKALYITGLASLLVGCSGEPEVLGSKDYTGDGITDILMNVDNFDKKYSGNYLFVGKADGTYERAKEENLEGITCYVSDSNVYFPDSGIYKKIEKMNK